MEKLEHRVRVFRVIPVPGIHGVAESRVGEVFSIPGVNPDFSSDSCLNCGLREKGCPGLVKAPWDEAKTCWGYNKGFHIERIR